MKSRGIILIALGLALVLVGALIIVIADGPEERPFEDLHADDIVAATVRLTPPDKTLKITDLDKLAALLSEVVLYEQDVNKAYKEHVGQGVTYHLQFADGRERAVMVYNPFVLINGVSYRTEYAPCEALNAYANSLLYDKNTQVLPDSPPDLTVLCGDTSIETLSGNFTWNLTIACGAHPLQCEGMVMEYGAHCETSEPTAALRFSDTDPDSLTVTCYPTSAWNDVNAVGETATVSGDVLTLQPGEWIYVVEAVWGDGMEQGGTVEYVFALNCTK